MADMAVLGLKIESKGLAEGVSALDRLKASAGTAEAAANKLAAATTSMSAANSNIARSSATAEAALKRQGAAMAQASRNAQQIGYQLNDLGVQLASGASPFTAIIQQGAQVSQLFQGSGGLKAAIGGIGSAFIGMLNPLNLAIIGIAAATTAIMSFGGSSTQAALEAHEDLIKRIQKAWKDAAGNVEDYQRAVERPSRVEAQRNVDAMTAALDKQKVAIADQIKQFSEYARREQELAQLYPEIGQNPGISNAVAGALKGLADNGDAAAFREYLDAITKASPALAEFLAPAQAVSDAFAAQQKNVQQAQAALDSLDGPITDTTKKQLDLADSAKEAAHGMTEADNAVKRLRDGLYSGQTELQKIQEDFETAAQGARTYSQALGIAELAQKRVNQLQDEASKKAGEHLQDAQARAAEVGMTPLERQRAEIDRRYQSDFDDNKDYPEALQKLHQARDTELSTLDQSSRLQPLLDANKALREQAAAIDAQAAAFGRGEGALARYKQEQALVNEYTRQGVPITDDMRKAIEAAGDAAARNAERSKEMADAQKELIQRADDIRSTTSGLISDLVKGRKPADIVKDLADKAIDNTVDTLTSSILGKQGEAPTGIFGSILGAFGLGGGLGTKPDGSASNPLHVVMAGAGGGGAGGLLGDLLSKKGDGKGTGETGSLADLIADPSKYWRGAKPVGMAGAGGGGGGLAGALPTGSIADYIRQAAVARGIDPSVALRVAQSEGGTRIWNLQSRVMKNGVQEPSFGPYQLYMKGGLGSKFQAATGLNPADASAGPRGVDFALDHAKQNGWGAWFGAKHVGISNWQGINRAAPDMPGGGDLSQATQDLQQAAQTAQTTLPQVASSIQGVAAASPGATQGLGSFIQQLTQIGSGGAGGAGGGGIFPWLFGGGGGGIGTGNSPPLTPGGFAGGGFTGHGHRSAPAGIVHRGEVVFSQSDVARHGGPAAVEAFRRGLPGYDSGGVVGRMTAPASRPSPSQSGRSGGNTYVSVQNNANAHARTEERKDSNGDARIDVFIDEIVAQKLTTPGTRSNRGLRTATGTTQPLTRR